MNFETRHLKKKRQPIKACVCVFSRRQWCEWKLCLNILLFFSEIAWYDVCCIWWRRVCYLWAEYYKLHIFSMFKMDIIITYLMIFAGLLILVVWYMLTFLPRHDRVAAAPIRIWYDNNKPSENKILEPRMNKTKAVN